MDVIGGFLPARIWNSIPLSFSETILNICGLSSGTIRLTTAGLSIVSSISDFVSAGDVRAGASDWDGTVVFTVLGTVAGTILIGTILGTILGTIHGGTAITPDGAILTGIIRIGEDIIRTGDLLL